MSNSQLCYFCLHFSFIVQSCISYTELVNCLCTKVKVLKYFLKLNESKDFLQQFQKKIVKINDFNLIFNGRAL